MNNFQDYYFERHSDVLFVDEDTQRVGILQEAPSYTLDVNGTINTSNILGVNILASNIQSDLILSDTVVASSNLTEFIQADNGHIENINSITMNNSSNVFIGSNLALLKTYINRECPIPNQGTLFGFSLGGGWIDPSWIKTDNDYMETLSTLWDIAQSGYDLYNLAQSILNPDGTLADGLKNQLDDALDGGDSNDQNKIYVDWGNVKHKPIYADKVNHNVGVKGNLYLNEAQSVYSLNSGAFTIGNQLNLNMTSTSNATKILDIGTHDAYLHDITASNIIVTSNLQATEINANEIITNTISGNSVRVGEFYVRSNGVFYGNPGNPFETKQIINSVGEFIGTVNKSQIIDLEAFDLSAIADGTLVWTGYGDVVGNTLFNDPFNMVSTPLFSVT
jgi:hypothetical protein